ncbi:MAG: TPM domain-containing protein, partial [Pseudanabaena sp.]
MIKLTPLRFMQQFTRRLGMIAIAIILPLAIVFVHVPSAKAYDAPELLPETYSNVIDLGRFLTEVEEKALDQKLTKFE